MSSGCYAIPQRGITNTVRQSFFGKGYNCLITIAVSLRDLVDELQMLSNEGTAYVNKVTGKVITITEEDVAMAEIDNEIEAELEDADDETMGEVSDLETQFHKEVKKILALDSDYLKLPSKFDIDEYEIMERFCLSFPDGEVSDVLPGKIRGSGAFRRFKDAIYQYGIENDWFKYRDEGYKEIAIAWLESNGLAYSDDMKR